MTLETGMKVLLKNLRRSDQKDFSEKFSYANEGPFIVLQVFENGTVRLAGYFGKPLPTLHNACNLKKYFESPNLQHQDDKRHVSETRESSLI